MFFHIVQITIKGAQIDIELICYPFLVNETYMAVCNMPVCTGNALGYLGRENSVCFCTIHIGTCYMSSDYKCLIAEFRILLKSMNSFAFTRKRTHAVSATTKAV